MFFQGTEIIHTEDVVTAEGSFQDDTRRVADKPNDIRNARYTACQATFLYVGNYTVYRTHCNIALLFNYLT